MDASISSLILDLAPIFVKGAKPAESKETTLPEIRRGANLAIALFGDSNYYQAISKLEWVVIKWARHRKYKVNLEVEKPGRDLLIRFLSDCHDILEDGRTLNAETETYVRSYLPLHLTELNTGQEFLSLILASLPEELKQEHTPEEQAAFICMALAIIHHESKFTPESIGPELKGRPDWDRAVGLMQVRPSTAGLTRDELLDPNTNLRAGLAYLYELFCKPTGEYNFEYKSVTLAAYSSGHRNGHRYKNKLYPRTVLAKYRLYRAFYSQEITDFIYASL